MGFSKTLVSAEGVSVSISESAGVASLSASLSKSAGGGEAAGIVAVSGSLNLSLDAKHLIDLGLELAEAKYPSVASVIALVKAGVDAEIAKL